MTESCFLWFIAALILGTVTLQALMNRRKRP